MAEPVKDPETIIREFCACWPERSVDRFLDFFKQAWPRLPATGLDMSEPYLAEAKRHLRRWCWLKLIIAKAEAIPLEPDSQDAAASIFLTRLVKGSLTSRAKIIATGLLPFCQTRQFFFPALWPVTFSGWKGT